MAKQAYKDMLVSSRLDDVKLTKAMTGLETNMLIPSLLAAGLDPNNLPERGSVSIDKDINPNAPRRWKDVWSAGHSVQMVDGVPAVAEMVARIAAEYRAVA